MSKITDGTSSTAMVVEVNPQSSVTWTKPDDYEYDASNPAAGLIGARPGGFNAAFCDGHVEFIPDQISPDTLKAMFTRDGGEAIDRNR